MKNELTPKKRLEVWTEVRAKLVRFIERQEWYHTNTTGLCRLLNKTLDEMGLIGFSTFSTGSMKNFWPEMYAYKPKWHNNAWWWTTSQRRGYTIRLSVVDAIIADLNKQINSCSDENGFHLILTEDKLKELRVAIADCYAKMRGYSLRGCSVNHLLSTYAECADALKPDGSTRVGTINGPQLIKNMTKEVFELICSVDPEFAKLVSTKANGESVRLLTTFLRFNRNTLKYERTLYRSADEDKNRYGDGFNRPSIRYAGKQLTFEQFDKWRKNFEARG